MGTLLRGESAAGAAKRVVRKLPTIDRDSSRRRGEDASVRCAAVEWSGLRAIRFSREVAAVVGRLGPAILRSLLLLRSFPVDRRISVRQVVRAGSTCRLPPRAHASPVGPFHFLRRPFRPCRSELYARDGRQIPGQPVLRGGAFRRQRRRARARGEVWRHHQDRLAHAERGGRPEAGRLHRTLLLSGADGIIVSCSDANKLADTIDKRSGRVSRS